MGLHNTLELFDRRHKHMSLDTLSECKLKETSDTEDKDKSETSVSRTGIQMD